jgi:hypothetical protein
VADNLTSRRAKANLPTVLLTLLSIVQALALELMWTHLGEQPYLYSWSFMAFLSWLQIGATFLGILLIWLIYSDLVLRLSWVPATIDSIFPFLVGIVEFAQISTLGPTKIGLWFLIMGVLFAAMPWVSQVTMKRARLDRDNEELFATIEPATWRDHLRSIIPAVGLMLMGVVFWVCGNQGWVALTAIVGVIMLLLFQIRLSHVFTQRSYESE